MPGTRDVPGRLAKVACTGNNQRQFHDSTVSHSLLDVLSERKLLVVFDLIRIFLRQDDPGPNWCVDLERLPNLTDK